MNEQRRKWIDLYIRSGDAARATAEAYPDVKPANRPAKTSHLKRELAEEIDKAGRKAYGGEVPLMMSIIKDLAINSEQDAVKLKSASEWLSRAGHDAALVIDDKRPESYDKLLQDAKQVLQAFDQETIKQLGIDLAGYERGGSDGEETAKH